MKALQKSQAEGFVLMHIDHYQAEMDVMLKHNTPVYDTLRAVMDQNHKEHEDKLVVCTVLLSFIGLIASNFTYVLIIAFCLSVGHLSIGLSVCRLSVCLHNCHITRELQSEWHPLQTLYTHIYILIKSWDCVWRLWFGTIRLSFS